MYFYNQDTLWAITFDGSRRDAVLKTTCTGWPSEGADVLLSPDGGRALVAAESNIAMVRLPKDGPAPSVCFDRGANPRVRALPATL